MRLSRIYMEQPLAVGTTVTLQTATSHYVRNVLRLKPGADCLLFNAEEPCDYRCSLQFNGKQTMACIETRIESASESSLDSEIIQGLSRGDHIDLSIQKCTELGVKRISIFNARHSQIPLKPAQQEKRLAHWRAIAIKACEQSGRHKPPAIDFFSRLEAALESSQARKNKLLLDFKGPPLPTYLSKREPQSQVSLLIGPEGGISIQELELAIQQGFISTRLGPRVLRTETAAMASLAIVQTIWGDYID